MKMTNKQIFEIVVEKLVKKRSKQQKVSCKKLKNVPTISSNQL
jgi:uncharacterized membrane protein